ncbi:hypothetical protein [Nocardioides sp.]|uniref:hypothetical protein n=1 Tax=Nocardioides sp. TaxID=35761 RepID=UPI003D0A7A6D
MSEETWNQARLIPTSGISGADEQERRATSALLAVLTSVKEFGRAITQPLGAPAGRIEAFIEVPFTLDGTRYFPDGLIRVTRGKSVWTALVEVKTNVNELQTQQLEHYLDIAREQGFDALLTISNEIPPGDGSHPTKVDGRKTRKIALHHLSWMDVLTEAVMQKEHRGVADPDQAWILGELIRYLEHPRSGALEMEDMGPAWVPTRDALAAGTLRSNDKGLPSVTARFDSLIQYCGLQLGRSLGKEVTPLLSRKERADAAVRSQSLIASLTSNGTMVGGLSIPGAVGPLHVTADLRASKVTCHVDLDAPREGRASTRVNWLLRQLKDAPDHLRIEAFVMHGRGDGVTELLGAVRENPRVLVVDPTRDIRSFRIASSCTMGSKRGRGRGGFIDSVAVAVNVFYADVVQNLRSWQATAPKLRELGPDETGDEQVDDSLVSTALSSQDGIETSEAAPVVLRAARVRLPGDSLDAFINLNGSRWARIPS